MVCVIAAKDNGFFCKRCTTAPSYVVADIKKGVPAFAETPLRNLSVGVVII